MKHKKTVVLIYQPDSPGGPLQDLTDMQCMWFALEDGESYMRQGKFGLALKRFHTIWKVPPLVSDFKILIPYLAL